MVHEKARTVKYIPSSDLVHGENGTTLTVRRGCAITFAVTESLSCFLRHIHRGCCDIYITFAVTFVKLVICCNICGVSGDIKRLRYMWHSPVARCGNIHLTVVNWLRG